MNTNKDDGGPAFPFTIEEHLPNIGNVPREHFSGMTLRDWFAGMAMQAMLASNPRLPKHVNVDNVDQVIAAESYASADAMLKERNK